MKRRISNSEMGTFRRCKRKWYLGQYRSLDKKKKDIGGPLRTGTIVHSALQAYYESPTFNPSAATRRLAALRKEEPRDQDGNEYPESIKSFRMADSVVRGYIEWVAETGYDSDFETVAAELPLQAPSPVEGVDLIGKVDLLGRRMNSDTYRIRDFKTVASLVTPLATLHLDRQLKLYHLLLKAVHPEWVSDGTEWMMLRKTLRTGKAEPPFYASYEVHHSDAELEIFWQQIFGEISEIMRAEERLNAGESHQIVAPPSPRNECAWDCPFLALCGPLDDPRSDVDYLLDSLYEHHDSLSRYEKDPEVTGDQPKDIL